MSEWQPKPDDIVINKSTKKVEIFVTSDEYGDDIYLILTFDEIEKLFRGTKND